jgi:hypothetical protein
VQAVLAARIDRLPPDEKRLLQTAMSLSRQWQRQGKRYAARQLLADVYG